MLILTIEELDKDPVVTMKKVISFWGSTITLALKQLPRSLMLEVIIKKILQQSFFSNPLNLKTE